LENRETPVKQIPIKTKSIQLDQFLKWADLVNSGGQAKSLIQEGKVLVNGEVEYSRGKKLYPGDRISFAGEAQEFQVSGD